MENQASNCSVQQTPLRLGFFFVVSLSFIVVVLLSIGPNVPTVAASATGGGAPPTHLIGDAYGLGVGLGFASFQGSVNQTSLAQTALMEVEPLARDLQNHGIPLNLDELRNVQNNTTYDGIVFLRGEYYGVLLNSNPPALVRAYNLGINIAIAEGETTARDQSGARPIIISALTNAQQDASALVQQGVAPQVLRLPLLQSAIDAANAGVSSSQLRGQISTLRILYQDTLNNVQP